jgi:hypothetical protein
MRKQVFVSILATVLCIFLKSEVATAQTDPPKLEVGAQFALMRQADRGVFGNFAVGVPSRWDGGFGGRFSYNLLKSVALEAEVNFFPREQDFFAGGRKVQGLFGVKAGWRNDRFGVFGKLRPGLMHFTGVLSCKDDDLSSCRASGRNEFALDAGGVGEFYPSRRTVLRVDVGDTIINFSDTNLVIPFPELPGGIFRFTKKGSRTHNLQINIGVGFRF